MLCASKRKNLRQIRSFHKRQWFFSRKKSDSFQSYLQLEKNSFSKQKNRVSIDFGSPKKRSGLFEKTVSFSERPLCSRAEIGRSVHQVSRIPFPRNAFLRQFLKHIFIKNYPISSQVRQWAFNAIFWASPRAFSRRRHFFRFAEKAFFQKSRKHIKLAEKSRSISTFVESSNTIHFFCFLSKALR